MMKALSLPHEEFKLARALLYVCKKPSVGSSANPQIDYILLDKEMELLQELQSKACQQIVQFVDQHHEEFIGINKRFESIEASIQGSETVLRSLLPKIDHYKSVHYSSEAKIQEAVGSYEKKMLQRQLVGESKEEAQFLIEFVRDFESIINVNIEDLSQRSKYFIVRLLRKNQYIRSLFEHPFVQCATSDHNSILNLVDNIVEELEFYLSEQLSRIASSSETRKIVADGVSLLEQIKIWYQYIGKEETFFETIEETIVSRELSSLQSRLISNKQALQIGKDEQIVDDFFQGLFNLVEEFPQEYPEQRILAIIYRFLTKKELNFLYAPVGPTFPIFYSSYKAHLHKISRTAIRKELQEHHGWNLRFWADLRMKSIMDRSAKDRENNLNKWVDIVFKKTFMLKGVKSSMIRLSLQLANRFAHQVESDTEFSVALLNDRFLQLSLTPETAERKLLEAYEEEMRSDPEQTRKMIGAVSRSLGDVIEGAVRSWVLRNIQMVVASCKSSLENYKSFVMKVVSKKQKTRLAINRKETILKPLTGYLANNPELSPPSIGFLTALVLREVVKHYDSEYAKEVYNYCQGHITVEQMKGVMDAVAQERMEIFEESAGQEKV